MNREAGHYGCTACPSGANVYYFGFSGSLNTYSPPTVSKPGSSSVGQCAVEFAQVEDGNWRLESTSHMVANAAPSLSACADACRSTPNDACQFISFDYSQAVGSQCQLRVMDSTAQSGT